MLGYLKRSNRFIPIIYVFMGEHQRLMRSIKPFNFFGDNFSQIRLYRIIQSEGFLGNNYQSRLSIVRNKSKSKKLPYGKRDEYDSDDDDDDDDDDDFDDDKLLDEGGLSTGKNSEVVTKNLKATRIDLIIKSVLKVNRKVIIISSNNPADKISFRQVEKYFYENKIRVNGRVLFKKSQCAQINDEIDLIYGFDKFNPNALKVGRINILKIKEDPDSDQGSIILKALKFKSLIIDNYTDGDEWKELQND